MGKTFIAAVVMYNFYRWYPQGKIVFTAPTRPLVAQQIEACFNIMGIPQSHMAEMTGKWNEMIKVFVKFQKSNSMFLQLPVEKNQKYYTLTKTSRAKE